MTDAGRTVLDKSKVSFLHFLKHWVGMDRAIGFTILARFWGAMAGLVTVLMIARFLTPSEQGYYYTFSSLVALQIVFELGFSFVILQLAAHERASLKLLPDGTVEGDSVAHSRLASIFQKAVRWYLVAGILMTIAILPAGWYFFASRSGVQAVTGWLIPWCLLVIASMLAFQIDPVFSFLEGCGFIAEVAQRRLIQAVFGSLLAWTALAVHRGLYAPAMVILGQVMVGFAFLFFSKLRHLLGNLWRFSVQEHAVGWRREIMPFQWRIAVSWLCGYFIFQIFNPILFAFKGPVVAGQMGMSLNIASAIGGIALAWMYTKASPFGTMVARGQFGELDRLFFRTLWQSTILLLIGGGAFLAVLRLVGHSFPRLAQRVLSPQICALLIVAQIMNHIVNCQAIYLRSHKREPFLIINIMSAVLITGGTFFCAKYYGANAVIVWLVLQGLFLGFPSATYIFVTKRSQWHTVPMPMAQIPLEMKGK